MRMVPVATITKNILQSLVLSAAVLFATACASKAPSGLTLAQSHSPAPALVSSGSCGDFLRVQSKAFEAVVFKGCEAGRLHQLRAEIASYEVVGLKAKEVEIELIRLFQMKPLRFVCCGWETSQAGRFKDANDNEYEVHMTSGETTEKNWSKIPAFHLKVYKLLEQP